MVGHEKGERYVWNQIPNQSNSSNYPARPHISLLLPKRLFYFTIGGTSCQSKGNVTSLMAQVKAEDEWCAEAYMETDYSTLTTESFERELKKYVAFRILNEDQQHN